MYFTFTRSPTLISGNLLTDSGTLMTTTFPFGPLSVTSRFEESTASTVAVMDWRSLASIGFFSWATASAARTHANRATGAKRYWSFIFSSSSRWPSPTSSNPILRILSTL